MSQLRQCAQSARHAAPHFLQKRIFRAINEGCAKSGLGIDSLKENFRQGSGCLYQSALFYCRADAANEDCDDDNIEPSHADLRVLEGLRAIAPSEMATLIVINVP